MKRLDLLSPPEHSLSRVAQSTARPCEQSDAETSLQQDGRIPHCLARIVSYFSNVIVVVVPRGLRSKAQVLYEAPQRIRPSSTFRNRTRIRTRQNLYTARRGCCDGQFLDIDVNGGDSIYMLLTLPAMTMKCVRKGCGKVFTDEQEDCHYHSGPPEFHEGQKGASNNIRVLAHLRAY